MTLSPSNATHTLALTSLPSKATRTLPKDLGSFRNLVAGWEQVGSQGRSPVKDVYSPMSPSSSYTLSDSSNLPSSNLSSSNLSSSNLSSYNLSSSNLPPSHLSSSNLSSYNPSSSNPPPSYLPYYLQSPTSISGSSKSSKSAALKEQFLRDVSPTSTPPTPPQSNSSSLTLTPTTPTYAGSGSSHRFAGVERLAQRQKIYEPQTSPDARKTQTSPDARKENLSVSVMSCAAANILLWQQGISNEADVEAFIYLSYHFFHLGRGTILSVLGLSTNEWVSCFFESHANIWVSCQYLNLMPIFESHTNFWV